MVLEYITEVKIYPKTSGKLVANGNFVVADALAVNFSVFRGDDGSMRVVLPNSPNPKFDSSKPAGKENKKFYDEVRPISLDRRQELEAYLLAQLDNAGGNNIDTDSPIPF